MKIRSLMVKPTLTLGLTLLFLLAGIGAAQATTLIHNAWGTNYSIAYPTDNALQLNATRNPGEGGPPFAGNTLLLLSDVTYW